jgi:hypothetical protein
MSGGKPIHLTGSVSEATLIEIWNAYVAWRTDTMPTLREEDQLFETTMNGERVWVIEDIPAGVIVQHGISELFEDPTQYDGEPRSSLNPDLPLEATIPTNCGELVLAHTLPRTGVGAVAPVSSDLSLVLGAATISSMLALGGLMILHTRKA